MREAIRKRVFIAVLLLAGAALCCMAAPLWSKWELFTHGSEYWFWMAVGLSFASFALGAPRSGAGAMVLAAYWGWAVIPYFKLAPDPGPALGEGMTALRVMHFNVLHINPEHQAVREFIAAQEPDVLIVQEYDAEWKKELAEVTERYPHATEHVMSGPGGMGVFSRFPLQGVGWSSRDDGWWPFVSCEIDVGGRPLRMVALHPPPPLRAGAARSRNAILREAGDAAGGGAPRIAVGDFNCTPWSPHFRDFCERSGLRDAALGRGLRRTWFPTALPFGIPIDHVLVSEEVAVRSYDTGPALGSDHRAVVVDLSF